MMYLFSVPMALLLVAAGNASTISLSTTCQANAADAATVTNSGSCSSWYAPKSATAYAQAEGSVSFGSNNMRMNTTQHAWYREDLSVGDPNDVSASVEPFAFAATLVRTYGITEGAVRPGKLNYFFTGGGFTSPDTGISPVHSWFDSAVLGIGAASVGAAVWSIDTTLGKPFDITAWSTLSTISGTSEFSARWATEFEIQFFEADGRTPVRIAEAAPIPEASTLFLGSLGLVAPIVFRRLRKPETPR